MGLVITTNPKAGCKAGSPTKHHCKYTYKNQKTRKKTNKKITLSIFNMDYKEFCKLLNSNNDGIQRMISNTWPRKVGIFAINQTKENFRKGGFLDKTRQPWDETKRQKRMKELLKKKKHTKSGKVTAASSYGPLLSSRNHLMQSTRADYRDGEVIIRNNVPYAAIHNEGGHAGRGRKVLIPKRQFIGPSEALGDKIINMITKDLEKLFQL